MPNLVEVTYAQTSGSIKTNDYGMREMQQRAFAARKAKYLLLKAPPASGKSRALMFIALDKLLNQGLKKVIIAVPEKAIGASFKACNLTSFGFFADWEPNSKWDLCTPGGDQSKVDAFVKFIDDENEPILICTHATLRFACENIEESKFDNTFLAIDEFHHVSADKDNNRLGALLHNIMLKSSAHIIAMTGSYFRGDGMPVLLPEDEIKFEKVTYNYYEQLNGYRFLKSLGIGYHFYQGKYTSAISEILDTNKKTILHIPNVNSGESTKQKYDEVDRIIDEIGTVVSQNPDTCVIEVQRKDGKIIKVADLVNDTPAQRNKLVEYLRNMASPDDMDLIIALGMAKEGFDWPYCEHALTVGYRGSLTEIIQIIGRCTRDSENKAHAQFTNLIAQPDATDDEVTLSVNNMLKAITCSLLMEQVLAPNFKFLNRQDGDKNEPESGEIKIKGFKMPSTKRVKDILETDLNDLKAKILQDDTIVKALPGNVEPEVINKILIPKVIKEVYPDLSDEEIDEVRQHVVADSVFSGSKIDSSGDKQFIRIASQFINIDDLHIDLIDKINPFQKAFEILSKNVTATTLKIIQDAIEVTRIDMTAQEAILLWPKIKEFYKATGKKPDKNSLNPLEKRMAEAIIFLRVEREKQGV